MSSLAALSVKNAEPVPAASRRIAIAVRRILKIFSN
jgi:hypothetical protein